MPLYTQENYCQEVWDLGRSIDKLNNYIINEYWELCEPEPLRQIYRYVKPNINKIMADDIDDDDDDEDLFIHYSQDRFNIIISYIERNTAQMPRHETIKEFFLQIVDRLRDLNNWFETRQGQTADWRRVRNQFIHNVNYTWWNSSEIMNYIPNADAASENQS